MKKTFTFLLISAILAGASTTASALGFSTVKSDDKSKNTFSKCAWESDPHLNKVLLKGKPGRNDQVWIRTDGKDFVIDTSPSIGMLSFLYGQNTTMEGKTLQVTKGSLHMEAESNPRATTLFTAKKSTIQVRRNLQFGVWEKLRSMSESKLVLEDTKMTLGGALVFNVPAWNAKFTKNRSGVTIQLVGDSFIKCKGDVLIDQIINEQPDLHFRFILNEKDGKMPFFSAKQGSIKNCELHLNIKNKLRKGIYPLLEATGSKAFDGKLRSMTLNGKNISFDTVTPLNGVDVIIKIGSADKKKANDIILEVK